MKLNASFYLLFSILVNLNLAQTNKSSSELSLIGFYQKYISGIRGQSCPMYPSCSAYGYEVFKSEGVLKGFLKTSDRLVRCGHESHLYKFTYTENGFKLLDAPSTLNSDSLIWRVKTIIPYRDFSSSDPDLNLAINLIENGLFSSAIIPLKRILLTRDNPSLEVFVNYLICLRALDKHELAIYEHDVKFPEEISKKPIILLQMARIAKDLENEILELTYFENINYDFLIENDLENQLFALRFLNNHDFDPQGMKGEKFKVLKDHMSNWDNAKYKKRALGGMLNVVPGAGYLYSGHKGTALSSFVLTSVLAFATFSSFENKNEGLGVLTGIFTASFYISGIIGGAKSVDRLNDFKKNVLKNNLLIKY